MRRVPIYILFIAILLPSCGSLSGNGNTSKVVKPKYHHSWYNRKKDKKVKRTRVVRMKN